MASYPLAKSLATPMRRGGTGDMDGVDAGWHADPTGRHEYRYWDGSGWTDQASDNGVPLLDPLAAHPSPEPAIGVPPAPKRKSVGAIAAIAGAVFLGLLLVAAAIGAAAAKPKNDGG